MALVRIEAHIATDDLIKAVERLEPAAFEQFIAQVIALRARRQARLLPAAEAELLGQINTGLPADVQYRYSELVAKRRAEQLTPGEQAELLHLTEQVEAQQAARAEQIVRLAQLRGCSPAQLVDELGLRPQPVP